jgi:hypothetical protein
VVVDRVDDLDRAIGKCQTDRFAKLVFCKTADEILARFLELKRQDKNLLAHRTVISASDIRKSDIPARTGHVTLRLSHGREKAFAFKVFGTSNQFAEILGNAR